MKGYAIETATEEGIVTAMVTPMECTGNEVLIDVWCPEDARLNMRTTLLKREYNREGVKKLLWERYGQVMTNKKSVC